VLRKTAEQLARLRAEIDAYEATHSARFDTRAAGLAESSGWGRLG
jgi:hypothetical protein